MGGLLMPGRSIGLSVGLVPRGLGGMGVETGTRKSTERSLHPDATYILAKVPAVCL